MIEYPDILADCGDKMRLDEGDVAGVGDVEERLGDDEETPGTAEGEPANADSTQGVRAKWP